MELKAIRDKVILRLEKEMEDEVEIKGGSKLYIATEFDPHRHARQYGIVESVPEHIDKYKKFQDGVTLKKGDKIWFHHFIIESAHKFDVDGERYYILPYEQLFAVEQGGDFKPLNDFVYVEPIEYDDDVFGDTVLSVRRGKTETLGKIRYASGYAKDWLKVKEGDEVAIGYGGAYDMKIYGETLYRSRARHLVMETNDASEETRKLLQLVKIK